MNNKTIITILAVSMLALGLATGVFVAGGHSGKFGTSSFASQGNTYNSATNTSVVCSGATSTQIVAASAGRLYFNITVASSTGIYLCKAATCIAGQGDTINASGGFYEQKLDDFYIGPYSCIGNGASSTIGSVYSQ